MRLLIRVLAVIALALSPVWGYQSVDAASSPAPAHYPTWPSFSSSGCNGIPGPGVSVTVSCGQGGFLLTQFNSGYACNEIDIFVNSITGGPFVAVGTVNSGSVSNTLTINDAGNWYMQFPFFLTNNLITLQITAQGTGGVMDMGLVSVPCNVPTDTSTVNPSFTPTVTPTLATGTPTPVPTFTPLPHGGSTFTPTITRTPVPGTSTATPTNTPGPAYRDCGSADFPVLNCDFLFGQAGVNPLHWVQASSNTLCEYPGLIVPGPGAYFVQANHVASTFCDQNVTAHANGTLQIIFKYDWVTSPNTGLYWYINGAVQFNTQTCPISGNSWCVSSITVSNGTTYDFGPEVGASGITQSVTIYLDSVFVSSSPNTPTVLPTSTTTVTNTPVPGTATQTSTPTQTPVPIPGAMSTNIPTATECPGGCAVAALTQIPGLSTRVTVDTSPFSPLENLSLARSSCAPFGFALVPVPHIIGTPAFGSTTPLSYTWTVPLTANWDDNHPYSNTAIQPCAMVNEIPPFIWDFTYWLSVLLLAIGWFLWLIGFVGRLSGEETING